MSLHLSRLDAWVVAGSITEIDRRSFLRYVIATGATAIAGCGAAPEAATPDGEMPEDPPTPTPTATPTATETPTQDGAITQERSVARQQFPDYNWSLLEQAEPTRTTTIEMTQTLRFRPTIAKVSAGATVTWTTPSVLHTLVIPQLDVDRRVPGGEQTSVTVTQPGIFDSVCDIHPPKMLGRLIVT